MVRLVVLEQQQVHLVLEELVEQQVLEELVVLKELRK